MGGCVTQVTVDPNARSVWALITANDFYGVSVIVGMGGGALNTTPDG